MSKEFDLSRFAYKSGNSSTYISKRSATEISLPTTRKSTLSRSSTMEDISTVKKRKHGYEPPESFAHLEGVPDYILEGSDLMIVGINPGRTSSIRGHHFAHPSNSFYACLYESGLTSRKLRPDEDYTLPEFGYSITNLNSRPTVMQSQLSKAESRASVPELVKKILRCKPKLVAFIGKAIWEDCEWVFKDAIKGFDSKAIKRTKTSKEKTGDCDESAGFLLQNYKIVHDDGSQSLFFTLPSTSGLVASYQKPAKVRAFTRCRETLEKLKCSHLDTTKMFTIDVEKLLD
ncbi:hypothetical protein E3Q24_01557 [Wallemia mellicola]|uniref:DNA glycosylase n=1 Tax=Wallemia mellicola TaxID=1708541 RepID=A0AB74KEL6_9BASI|nr:hypothetical protein E3Q24_01557 [Wallemia mellicola]TIC66594.1 DNA glycosylase [Wallemia mellicola]